MDAWDWTPYLVDGGLRPDAMNIDPAFNSALVSLFSAAPENIRANLRIGSGFRSNDRQAELWAAALQKYGSPEAARKWVAPPGRSNHNHGEAADLKYLDPTAQQWVHDNAAQYGLSFPLSNEPWHVEPVGARGGQPLSFGSGVPAANTSSYSVPAAAFSMGVPVPGAEQNTLLAQALNRPKQRAEEEQKRREGLASLIR